MKYSKLICMFVLSATVANAQTSKGSWQIGSTVGLSMAAPLNITGPNADNHAGVNFLNTTLKAGGVKTRLNSTVVSLAPGAGYFIVDGLMVGINVNFTLVNFEGDNTSYLSFTPQVRYYFNNTAKVRPFGEVRGGVLFVNEPNDISYTTRVLGVRGGLAIFVNEKVSLDILLDYARSKDGERDGSVTNSAFGVGFGFDIFL